MRPLIITCVLVCAVLAGFSSAQAAEWVVAGDSLSGRVFNASTNTGLSGYSVRLISPRVSGLPIRVAFTGQDGRFRFNAIKQQRYVLEIMRGVAVVYRKEIDTSQPQSVKVALRPISARVR